MATTDIVHPIAIERVPDLVHRVRGLRFFTRHVGDGIGAIGRSEGFDARFDRTVAASVFLDWVEQITAQRAAGRQDRRDYICFSAGVLLKTLLSRKAVAARPQLGVPGGPAAEIVRIWPEGYLATSYCITVLDAVLDQERLEPCRLQPVVGRVDAWQSYRETVQDDPWAAIGFLDLFVGNEPDWRTPSMARQRPAIRRAARAIRVLAS